MLLSELNMIYKRKTKLLKM